MSLRRSALWMADRHPLDSAGPQPSTWRVAAPWCDLQHWALATCDAASQRASLVALGGRETLDCRASSEIDPELAPAVHGQWWRDIFVPSVCCLALSLYLLHMVRQTRRHVENRERESAKPAASRSQVVDVFRGLTLVLMVFVNYGGGGLALFLHSAWDGFTVADAVFPCFAWIMGFTMAIRSARAPSPWRRVVARSTKLFVLGLLLNNGASWTEWRIPGVLQALSVAYVATASLTRLVDRLTSRSGHRSQAVLLLAHLIVGILPLLTINLALTFGLHVPGCPTGYIGPGGDSDGGHFRNCTGGAHLFVDLAVFGETHIYQTPTCQRAFHTGAFDPEGLLNWLMVAVTTYAGFLGGLLFKSREHRAASAQAKPFLSLALATAVLSTAVSSGLGSVGIPLNKNLWSLSYVLASVAAASATFAALLLLGVDQSRAKTWVQWTTWLHVGRNSILVYAMHEVLQAYAPFSARPFLPSAQVAQVVVLLHNVAGVLWWIFVAEWLHARGIFITV